jgi:riboflavin kinase
MISNGIVIFGRAVKGLKESNLFMEVLWVKEQFVSKLGFAPYPGTFNLEIVDGESLMRWQREKKREGIEIRPQENGFCSARCYRVLVADNIEGAIVVPEVSGYPDSKLEIIAPRNIRGELALTDGDLVKVEIIVEREE